MKFSIVTVTKNNKAGLLRAIESVRSQSYKNVEHIIVDGGSTDGSVEILRQAQDDKSKSDMSSRANVRDLKDFSGASLLRNDSKDDTSSRTRHTERSRSARDLKISPSGRNDKDQGDKSLLTNHYSLLTISEADSGIYDAINKGIKLATGDVIGLLHSDDFFKDEFVLEKYASAFAQCAEHQTHSSLSSRTNVRDLKISPPPSQSQNDNLPPTTDNLPPATVNPQPAIDAVYSDLVYVSQKTKVKSQKSKNEELRIEEKDFSPLRRSPKGMALPEMTTPEVRKQTTNDSLLTNYSIIRTWKTHKIVNSKQKLVNSGSTTHYSPLTTHHLLNGWMPPHPTLFVRKEIFEKYGLYRTDMKIAADYEMILRLFLKHKITTHYLPITTYCMTIGGASNRSLKNIFIKSSEDYKAMKMHGLPFPVKTLLMKNLRKLPQFFG